QVRQPIRKQRNTTGIKRTRRRQATEKQLEKRLKRKIRLRGRAQKSYYHRKRAAKIAAEREIKRIEKEAKSKAWREKRERKAQEREFAEQSKANPAKPKRPTKWDSVFTEGYRQGFQAGQEYAKQSG